MDETEFDPGATSKKKKISQFVQEIIEEIHYYDTILPRIPVMIQRTMQVCFSFCSLPEGFFFFSRARKGGALAEKRKLLGLLQVKACCFFASCNRAATTDLQQSCSVYYRLRLTASLLVYYRKTSCDSSTRRRSSQTSAGKLELARRYLKNTTQV